MRDYVQSAIDELRRYHLPKDVRDSYAWDTSHTLSLTICRQCGIATLAELQDQPAPEEMHCQFDQHGRITIPQVVMHFLDWNVHDQIKASPSHKGHAITLAKR